MPADLAETPCSQALKDLLYADWLAKQGKGEWTLEAMQLVAPLAAGSLKAAAWMDRVLSFVATNSPQAPFS